VLPGHRGPCFGASFVGDGKKLLSWSSDSTLRVWDLMSNEEQKQIRINPAGKFPILSCTFQAQEAATTGTAVCICGGGGSESSSFLGVPLHLLSMSKVVAV
jgi:WD40 repeat protein